MKISESWLREWINPELSAIELSTKLTLAGLEVDHVSPVANLFTGVIVACVLTTRPHPQADRLTICEVDTGASVLQIVCGAQNVRPHLKVALATIGACLSPEFRIKESKLRGELSQGMLCSAKELGMQDTSEGILELPEDAPVGADLREYLQLNDHIIDIDLTPNRADCLSIRGIAREVAAQNKLPFNERAISAVTAITTEQHYAEVASLNACPKYALRVITGIQPNAKTPLWMQERLRRCGIQVIHPVVDVVNYVMLELGQPMHAFDLRKVQGNFKVRYARKDEQLTLLNEQIVTLDESVLVIADENQPLAMAGIMGGNQSAVSSDTTAIVLESAFFNPLVITGIARRYGLTTESSQRFERGVDPQLPTIALERVTALLLSIVGGEVGPISLIEDKHAYPQNKIIPFNPLRFTQITGVKVSEENIYDIFQDLGFEVEKGTPWMVNVPAYRFDISLEVDLIEEILRLHGYDKIENASAMVDMQCGKIHPNQKKTMQIAHLLQSRGYHETISYSFVDPELQRQFYPDSVGMTILNPISTELSEMRLSLWPGLIASLLRNVNRQQTSIRCFETGVIFNKTDSSLEEETVFGGVLSGETGSLKWNEVTRTFDFFDMKGDLEFIFSTLKCADHLSFVKDTHIALHPGQSARILWNDLPVGWMGALHPRLLDAFDLTQPVFLFELKLAPFLHENPVRYQKISKYPQIRRDLSLLVDHDTPVAEIEQVIRSIAPSTQLKGFHVFDQYIGDSLPLNKKSIAVALTLQDDERTLVDEEINRIISAILKELEVQLTIVLRDQQ